MKLNKLTALFASAILMVGAVGCSDDNMPATPLDTAQGALDNSSFNTLTFEWEKVPGATQYSYQLSDTEGNPVVTEMTSGTTVTITDLKPSTDYILSVVAYAVPYGDRLNSEPLILRARTSDIIVLATPQVTYDRLANNLTFSWNAVDGAEGYTYSFTGGSVDKSGTITDTSVTFNGLDSGTYTFVVTADIDQPGYASSEPASVEVNFEWVDPVAWSVVGTYTSEKLGESWPATLVSYTDGTYSLKAWYNVEGYDLDFSIDESTPDDMFVLSDDCEWESGWPKVYTGLTKAPKYFYLYIWDNYCWLSEEDGEMGLDVYYSGYYYDTFKWDPAALKVSGKWTMTTSATSELENDNWTPEQYNSTLKCEVTQIGVNTFKFPAFYFYPTDVYYEEPEENLPYMTVTVDWDTNTLTVNPTPGYWGYYTLAGDAGSSSDIVGTINADGSMTFTGCAAWYKSNKFVYNGTVTFTR